MNVCYSFVFWICPESDVDSLHHPVISCHQHLSEDFCSRRVEFQRNASTKKLPPSFDACHLHGSLSVSYFLVESADQIRRASQKTERFPVSGFRFHSETYFAMNPRYQDGSFQTVADMLRNQHREFVEPLMQQMAVNFGDILAASISFAVGQAVQAAHNRDVRPWRESDYGTTQHRLMLSMCCADTTRRLKIAWPSSSHNKRSPRNTHS